MSAGSASAHESSVFVQCVECAGGAVNGRATGSASGDRAAATIIRALVPAGGAWRDWRGKHGDYAHPLAKAVQSCPGIAAGNHFAPLRTGAYLRFVCL